MKKPIVVAGNGPSLAKIDYRRLPADFDVFRCNQFYFEEKYYLGKKITGAFISPWLTKHQYFTLRELKKKNEYYINQIYLWPDKNWEKNEEYPAIKKTFQLLQSVPKFYEVFCFYSMYYGKIFTSTIIMLMIAVAMGYKKIYLVGLDFYEGGGVNYAFKADRSNAVKLMPTLADFSWKDSQHNKNVDLEGLFTVLEIPDVEIFSISENTPLNEYIQLAPIVHETFIPPEQKPADAILDFLPLPIPEKYGKALTFCKKIGLEKEYLSIKGTVIGKIGLLAFTLVKDVVICLKAGLKILLKVWKIPILLIKNKRINK